MPYIDFERVKDLVTLRFVLEELGIVPRWTTNWQGYGPCPLSCAASLTKRDAHRCCSYDESKGLWKCQRCGRGGSQIDLYAERHGLTVYTAAIILCQLAGVVLPLAQPPRGE